ncbi:response regulator transcription factor [Patescibacteria group bacterium]|nr:response regulator transcription factor [Patescibacteria group bacterium]
MKLLVVEDEPKLNKGLVEGLKQRGYTVDSALDGVEGEQLARLNEYDLILLDVMMPNRDGLEMCRNLRAFHVDTPILFLTAKDALEDKIRGLDIGGDDYLVKPFAFEELVARIRTLLRRPRQTVEDILVFEGLRLNTKAQTLTVDGTAIELTLREYGILEYLLRHRNEVVTREDLLSHVWDRFFDSFSNVVDVHLKNLRKKLPSSYAHRLKTVWGKGYRLA